MSLNDKLLEQSQEVDKLQDQSKETSGGPRLPLAGKTPARLIGVIELGMQPQEFDGNATDPAPEIQLVFECYGKNLDEVEVEVDGKKTTKKLGRIFRPYPMKVALSAKANYRKLFKEMDYGRGNKHMSQMLNDVFLIDIEHKKTKKGNPYAAIKSIGKPIIEIVDPNTGEFGDPVDISSKQPAATRDFQMFLMDNPSQEQWDSIHIDGTYTRKTKNKDGEEIEEEVSKNFIQERIKSSLNWEGSAMQTLLADLGTEPEAPAKEAEEPKEEAPSATDAAAAALAELGM